MTKQQLRDLGREVGLDFCYSEFNQFWDETAYTFQYQPNPHKHEFKVFHFLAEDLTPHNMIRCKANGFSRTLS